MVAGAQEAAETAPVSAAAEARWVNGFSRGANARHNGCLTPMKHAAVVAGVSQASRSRYFSLEGRANIQNALPGGRQPRTGDEKRKQDIAGGVRLVPDERSLLLRKRPESLSALSP